jgi:hypothetical protein
MPVPRHSRELPSVQLQAEAECGGVAEVRVHGVGGSPPDAILGDLAPEQASGGAIAGFYRSSDDCASAGDRETCLDVDRHVEAYSWGGLTSRSKVRVLWLALLPFLFGNLAGWMCSASTRTFGRHIAADASIGPSTAAEPACLGGVLAMCGAARAAATQSRP